MGRHRHAVTVRADGLGTVLGPLVRDPRVRAATLVDVGSGMVLDGWGRDGAGDPELVGAAAAELVRIAVGMLGSAEPEVVVGLGGSWHHVVRAVPDPGGPLALSVLVEGPQSAVERTRRRLRRVPVAALSAGPSASRRPGDGTWALPPVAPTVTPTGTAPAGPHPRPSRAPGLRLGGLRAAPIPGRAAPPTPVPAPSRRAVSSARRPAPLAALPPAPREP